jgi:hypothetical protein
MGLNKSLARLGGIIAFAALLLGAGLAFAPTVQAQSHMLVYGPAPDADSEVVVFVEGIECKTAEVDAEGTSATGYLWGAEIDEGECGAQTDSLISFTLDGQLANETLEWRANGLPEDPVVGIVLTVDDAATPTPTPTPENPIATPTPAPENPVATGTPTPPESGNAGLAGGVGSSPWLVLGLGALALATLAGARSMKGRSR